MDNFKKANLPLYFENYIVTRGEFLEFCLPFWFQLCCNVDFNVISHDQTVLGINLRIINAGCFSH